MLSTSCSKNFHNIPNFVKIYRTVCFTKMSHTDTPCRETTVTARQTERATITPQTAPAGGPTQTIQVAANVINTLAESLSGVYKPSGVTVVSLTVGMNHSAQLNSPHDFTQTVLRNGTQRSARRRSILLWVGVHTLFLPSADIYTTFLLNEFKEGAGNMIQLIKMSFTSRRTLMTQKTSSEQRQLPDKIMSLYVPM
jgi:hypothetical protein